MSINRRSFIFGSAAAVTLAGQATSKVGLRPLKAGEKRRVAMIGYGIQMRTALIPQFLQNNVDIVAVCDCDRTRAKAGAKQVNRARKNSSCKAVFDFREVLKDPSIDMVCIATPDHWHAYISVEAMKHGKDVYCEKPLTFSIDESKKVMAAQKKNGDANWEAEPFRSSVNREAGFATFMLCGGGNAWAKSLPKVKGKVTVTVADKMATKELPGKISSGKIGEGEYSYKVKLASNLMSDKKSLEVSPVGSKADCELEVYCGNKKLGSTGSFSMNGKKSYNFKKPDGDDIVIKIKYPEGAKKLVVPFG